MRRRKITLVPQEPTIKEGCRHYWIIESAHGPVSKGVCKFCGAVKEFHNSWPYFPVAEKVPGKGKKTELEVGEPLEEDFPPEQGIE